MVMNDISISEFKAKCLGLIEQVHKTGQPLRITRHGRPVAEVIPAGPDRKRKFLGDMIGTAKIVGDIVSPIIELAKQLADALGGELAASRPICDNGWLPMDRQVGSSGQTVAPKLYLALGISGAIQHMVGMKGSRSIVAINKDSEAPIFEIADFAVVGNLFDIVPPLIEEVKKAKG